MLKISVFEGAQGLPLALSLITLVFLLLIVLPFIDRGSTRSMSKRPLYVTLGLVFVAEVVVLSYWGLVSPGETIPVEQAALIIGGTALLIGLGSYAIYRLMYSGARRMLPTVPAARIPKTEIWTGMAFTGLVGLGALAIGSTLNGLAGVVLQGFSLSAIGYLGVSVAALALVSLATAFMIYRLDFRTGNIGRRVRIFEGGLRDE